MTRIIIHTEYITLQDLLKWGGLTESGGQAKRLIQGGAVTVNGQTCLLRGRKLRPGDVAACNGREVEVAYAD